MRKDPTEFRKRFAAWKNGESVYKHGLPTYEKGKDPYEDFVDSVIKEEGFLIQPTDIGDGKITIGSGLTSQKWIDLYNQKNAWSVSDNRRAVKEELANTEKWLKRLFQNYDQLPERAKHVLMDIGYNVGSGTLSEKKSPKFVNAVRSGNWNEAMRQMDWGNNQVDSLGRPFTGLRKRNERRQAAWADAFGLTTPKNIKQKANSFVADPYIEEPDATAVRQIIPQEQTIPAFDTTISPYISGQPMLNLKKDVELPNIVELLEDSKWQPQFRRFQNGKEPELKQGPKKIPIDKVEDWSVSKSNGNEWSDYWKSRTRPAVKAVKTVTRPYRNIVNGRGKKQDLIDVGFDLLGGAAVKAVGKIRQALKPVVSPIIKSLKGKTPMEVGQYFESHPELTTDINPTKLKEARDFIMGDAVPRVQKEFASRGKKVDYTPTSVYKQADFMDSELGGVSTPNGVVYMRKDPKTQWLVHEEAHEMRRKTGETAEEASRLFSTYANSPEFLKKHPEYNALKEYEAINTELRYLISYANGGVKGKELDSIIDNMPYEDFERYAILANAYTNDAARNKLINPKTWKNTQKTVGMAGPRDNSQEFIKAKDGKLPNFVWGKHYVIGNGNPTYDYYNNNTNTQNELRNK